MATATTNLVFTNATDAQFRAWGSWFDGLWATFGWTQVYSLFGTGTNWTDVTAPLAANQARVTKVYQVGDGLANAAYLKIEYGSAAAAGTPGIRITFGTGHSAGTITGVVYVDTTATFRGISTVNTNSNNHFATGSSDRFCIAFNVTGTSITTANQLLLSIDRRRNGSGTAQTTGYLFAMMYATSSLQSVGIKTGVAPNSLLLWATPGIGNAVQQVYDGAAAINPIMYNIGYSEFGLNLVSYPNAFFTAGATFSASLLGASITYLALGSLTASMTEASSGASRPAMRYD
jgi:hypothetical protein